jgi:GNAT superfamily N-acetyltransferase
MTWRLTSDLDAFDAAAGAFLAAEPTRNTVLISVPTMLRHNGPTTFGPEPPGLGWFEKVGVDGAEVEGARAVQAVFVHTPPHPLLLSPLPDGAAELLVAALIDAGRLPSAVDGPLDSAQDFADAWRAATGRSHVVRRRTRLYVLPELIWPSPMPPGTARIGTEADLELLVRWYVEFGAEAGEPRPTVEPIVRDRIGYGGLTLWEVDGVPVSMAGVTRMLDGGGMRVAPVYTPKPLRGRGYAGAVTAAVSQAALDAGAAEVSLFTDLANPTSNALYQRLGYRSLEDRVILEFED